MATLPDKILPSVLRIELAKRIDRDGKPYLLGKPRLPALIDLSSCAIFVWLEDPDGPSMTISKERDRREDEDFHKSPTNE